MPGLGQFEMPAGRPGTAGLAGLARSSLKAFTRRNRGMVTEGHPEWREALPGVDRVVDRVPGAVCAFCAFCAFGRAIRAVGALWAGQRGHGKEKVYGSIP